MLVRVKRLGAGQLSDEQVRLVDQDRKALRADVGRAGAMGDGDQRHFFDRSFAVHTLQRCLSVVHDRPFPRPARFWKPGGSTVY